MKPSPPKAAPRDGGGIVYSTGDGERCPNCQRAVRVSRETQGRKGKGVTVISGLGLPETELAALATHLKKRCGSGGLVENGRIEIQGDHRDRLVDELTRRGWMTKRAGG